MEIRQLEYFIVSYEKGSFSQAAQCLYTTQPNVSKVITNLEKELGNQLFIRNSRGLEITPYGRTVLEYARNILQNVEMINVGKVALRKANLSISTYSSNQISKLIADCYKRRGSGFVCRHLIGNVEEICDNVAKGVSEIGILYVAKKQMQAFLHILSHKKLKYVELDIKELCLYIGKNHPKYDAESIIFSELPNQRYVGGLRDFFSMEHHLKQVSLGAISTSELNYSFYTNSPQSMISILEHTDVASLGIDFVYEKYRISSIKSLKIKDCEPFLSVGYVCLEDGKLSGQVKDFLEELKKIL